MASYERASLPVRSRNEGNSRTCVILCISKAGYEGDTSCLYAAKVDDDGSLGRGDPFRLTNNQGRYIWNNNEISMLRIRVGDIVKCHVAGNQYVYDVKTSKRMVSYHLPLELKVVFYPDSFILIIQFLVLFLLLWNGLSICSGRQKLEGVKFRT